MPCASSRSSAIACAQLRVGLVEPATTSGSTPAASLRADKAQREREPDEPLLGAVVEVALEPPALGVAGLDDAGARRAQLLELRAHLGLQPLVLEREPRGRGHLVDELLVGEQSRARARAQPPPAPSRTRLVCSR